ncbi:hypothetical protein CDD83_19 [Cordyceps sp. RAO-2017]|nr:hypothetical protein CDD83_19 [Cordyceps sp. RAO-2017]
MIGAEIYCTVGSREKIDYLMGNHGIPRAHIFHSMDSSFLGDVRRATDNRGVDVVLNSLSGDLLHASWECVAEFGTMVEIGKRDFRRRAKLSMETFEANRTFIGLDVKRWVDLRQNEAIGVVKRCLGWMRSGSLDPTIAIAGVWKAEQVRDAFRFMQSGQHIGKIVIRMPEEASSLASVSPRRSVSLRADRSYLLVGGLGGLGRAIATWLVEQGARQLIFLSRSAAARPELDGFLAELSSMGCRVQLVQGDARSIADVRRAVDSAAAPIAGVVNLAMDKSLDEMSFEDWTAAVEPKVQSTWNLHHAISSDLDFFVLTSSVCGIMGRQGQANYSAAGSFLDAFVQYRHHTGLAASVIDIGVVGGLGCVMEAGEGFLYGMQISTGVQIIGEQNLFEAMILAIHRSRGAPIESMPDGARRSPGQIVLGLYPPILRPKILSRFLMDARLAIIHNVRNQKSRAAQGSLNESELDSFMSSIAAQPSILEEADKVATFIAAEVTSALAKMLMKDEGSIGVEHSPQQAGNDSLVGLEMRTWIRQRLGVDVSVPSIVKRTSFMALGELIRLALVRTFAK